MNRKEIKKFYLSLIDNPDAVWSKEVSSFGTKEYLLLHCTCNNIRIRAYHDYQLVFTYTGGKDSRFEQSDTVTYQDLGISTFRLIFPYFGIAARIQRRIERDKRNKNTLESTIKLDSVSSILSKDKVLNRDNKLNQLLDK